MSQWEGLSDSPVKGPAITHNAEKKVDGQLPSVD